LLQAEVREVIEGGDPPMRKALLQSLVDEIRVVSARRSSRPSLCLRFDHRNEQYRYGDSNPGFRTENPAS
jgi:hypothetical protein